MGGPCAGERGAILPVVGGLRPDYNRRTKTRRSDMDLQNKVALVTGAGSGIGKASAIAFARAGAKVGLVDHGEQDNAQTASEIQDGGGQALAVTADVSDAEQMRSAVAKIVDRFGRLDIVYANAGINGVAAPIDDLTPEEWDHTININLRGTFLTIRYSVPHLKKAGGGSIIVTSSINGTRFFANAGATAYSVSKAGQLAMVQMLAVELGPNGIRVNAICPGAIKTDIDSSTEKRNVEKIKIEGHFERDIPLTNKPGSAQQVAQLALFLASDAASHITGTPVWIDGAQSLLR
jgi:NAD(P)-dependent dehydrogenase (short-subunit alcohol dehydrogenase family)